MKRSLAFAFVAILAAFGAGPARSLPAGVIATDNVSYVASVPDVPAIGGKIIGTTMYVTTLRGVRTYDVSLGVPVPMGAFELPHWQNEAVDTNGRLLLVSADHVSGPSILYVFDVSNPRVILPLSAIPLSGSGHTATCIKDCRYAWTRAGQVIDLTDPTKPRSRGFISYGRHHTDVDEAGIAWVDGHAALDTNTYGESNLLNPTPYAATTGRGYGWHGTLRPDARLATPATLRTAAVDPGELILGSDENWVAYANSACASDGEFITSHLRERNGQLVVETLDEFRVGQGTLPGSMPAAATCSSHWFDHHEGIVANGWYEQGVRFLDVSDPRDITEIGYWIPPNAFSWMALFNEVTSGPAPGLYVYTFDPVRGIDVLTFSGSAGDAGVAVSPLVPGTALAAPDPEYGYACRIL